MLRRLLKRRGGAAQRGSSEKRGRGTLRMVLGLDSRALSRRSLPALRKMIEGKYVNYAKRI